MVFVVVFAMVFALVSSLPGASLAAGPISPEASAKVNYAFYCAPCHGTGGRGDGINATKTQPVSPRDHTNKTQMQKLTDSDIINVIRRGGGSVGRSTLMPPFAKTLSEREVLELKELLRTLCKCKGR